MFSLKRNASGSGAEYMGFDEIKVLCVFPVAARENDGQTDWVSPEWCDTEVICFALVVVDGKTRTIGWCDILHDIETGWLSYSE